MIRLLDPGDKDTPAAEATEGLSDDQLRGLWTIIRSKKKDISRGTSRMSNTLVEQWHQYLG